MKCLFVFLAVVGAVASARLPRETQNKYTTRYDNMDLDEILKSERLVNNYFNCLMEKGKCTPEGSELKRTLPEALETECQKCSEKQKNGTTKVINFLIKNRPELWKELQAKYDPEGKYTSKYKKEGEEKYGIYLDN